MKIGEKTFVSLSYSLEVDGNVVDSTTAENPLEFVFGAGFLLPKFEEQIAGKKKGEAFKFTLSAADGYGETIAEAVVELPQSLFMIDGVVEEGLLVVGNQIPMSTADGQHMMGIVAEIGTDTVKMDFNHPMAGKTLNFSGTVEGVREAVEADMMQGMMAGDGCGGDCSGGCDSCGDEEEGEDCGCC